MQNSLSKYTNTNYKDILTSIEVKQGTARESGNIYYYIELRFINGYAKRIFLSGDQQFAWCNAFDLLDSQKVVDNSF